MSGSQRLFMAGTAGSFGLGSVFLASTLVVTAATVFALWLLVAPAKARA